MIARKLGLIPSSMALEESRYEHLPDFHPMRSEQSEHIYKLIQQFNELNPPLTQIQLFQLLHLVYERPLEEIEAEYAASIPQPPNPYDPETSPVFRQAYSIFTELRSLARGATLANKRDMLWRIAVRNENRRPDLSIAAINALNKTQIAHGEIAPQNTSGGGGNSSAGFTLILQNPQLLNAPLDQIEEAEIVDG
jgi:hypothetical protein